MLDKHLMKFNHKIFEYGVAALNLMGSEKKLDNMDLFSSCILFTGDLKRKISLFHSSSWSGSTAPLKPEKEFFLELFVSDEFVLLF